MPPLGQLWGMLIRRRWLILGAMVCTIGATAFFTYRQTPVYQASTLLRLQDKQPNLPEVFRNLGRGSELSTEIGVLSSRALIEDAVGHTALRLRVLFPKGVSLSQLITEAEVADSAPTARYALVRTATDCFTITDVTTKQQIGMAHPGFPTTFAGVRLTLLPSANEVAEIDLEVRNLVAVVSETQEALSVSQPAREADILRLDYEGTDPDQVRRVANTIAARYIERRQDAFKADARRSATFLAEQVDRVGSQLLEVEDSFRRFRERAQVIDPATEASGQVSRLINKEAERSSLEAEREALSQSLDELNRAAAHRAPGAPSPYRQLLSFPTLLRSQAASQLLNTLAAAESERTTLLTRRTEQDPDVRILTSRIEELEEQLRSIAVTYLEGLTNQVAALDTTLRGFNRELEAIPRKQVQYARLQRRSKGLEEAYNLLQTRLKESEIAQAVDDPSVQIVDTAVTPLRPIRPKPALNLMGGLLVGLMLGAAGAFLREQLDRSVRTRRDVIVATGLPVMGLIPRLDRTDGRVALITHRQKVPRRRAVEESKSFASPPKSRIYTFLSGASAASASAESTRPDPEPVAAPAASVPELGYRLTLTASGTPAAEAYGILQTNIAFARQADVKTLVLTSPLSGDGKSTCAVNLSLTLAHRGLKTLLIDADMRRGVVHVAFGTSKEPGLADVLNEKIAVEQAVRHVEIGDHHAVLHFLTAGTLPPNPSGLIDSPRMLPLLEQLATTYDRIIIDSPPVNIVTDAALLGSAVDGVLLVARAGVTQSAALAYAIEQLQRVGAPVLGVVLNDIDFRRDASYDQAFKYYNHNEYSGQSTGT